MAPKREKSLFEDPPAASSSEEEEVEEIDDEEEDVEEEEHEVDEEEEEEDDEEVLEEEDDDEVTRGKLNSSSTVENPKFDSTPNSGSKTQTPSSDDDEEEEDQSEESDSEPTPLKLKSLGTPRGSNPRAGKPIALKPKKTESKPSMTTPLASSTKPSATAKRPLESGKDSKRKKKKVDDKDSHQEESEKRSTFGPNSIFQRVWSDDDEIVLLKAMIESKKKGVDPVSNLSQFFESLKKTLQVEVRLDQLHNKIKRLRTKFLNNFKKAQGDADPVFSKPHEVLSYQLMKEIWDGKEGRSRGGGSAVANGKNGSVVANGKNKSKKSNNGGSMVRTKTLSDISMRESPKLDGSNGLLHPCVQEMVHCRDNTNMVGGSFLQQGLDLIGDSKRKDFEKKWRSLHVAELKHYLTRIELVREQTVAIIDAYKSSDA